MGVQAMTKATPFCFAAVLLFFFAAFASGKERKGFNVYKPQPPHITLRYFDIRGRVEPVRIALYYLGIHYYEELFEYCPNHDCEGAASDWETYKSKGHSQMLAFGQVPCMTYVSQKTAKRVDIVQTSAILRYIAKMHNEKHQFYGNHNSTWGMHEHEVDIVVGGAEDLYEKYHALAHNPEVLTDPSVLETYKTVTLPLWLGHFEGLLARSTSKNIHDHKWFAGDKVTLADVLVWNNLDLHRRLFADCLDSFPLLQDFFKVFASKKRINKYLRSHFRRHWANGRKAFLDSKQYPPTGLRHHTELKHTEL